MVELNKVFLVGNLTRDPEVRYLPQTGSAVTEFDIAVSRSYKDKSNEKREETMFIRVTTFSKLAEICGEYLKKGRAVFVEGRLKQDAWEAKDGTGKRTRISVVANAVQFFPLKQAFTEAPLPGGEVPGSLESPELGMEDISGGTEDDLPF